MVPKSVTRDQLNEISAICDGFINMVDSNPDILNRMIMWCYLFNPQTKWQLLYWKLLNSPLKQTFAPDRSKSKVMLEGFCDSKGIVHQEGIPQGHTVNKIMYRDILHCLKRCCLSETPGCAMSRKLDSAP
jgi:hypothetical protein